VEQSAANKSKKISILKIFFIVLFSIQIFLNIRSIYQTRIRFIFWLGSIFIITLMFFRKNYSEYVVEDLKDGNK